MNKPLLLIGLSLSLVFSQADVGRAAQVEKTQSLEEARKLRLSLRFPYGSRSLPQVENKPKAKAKAKAKPEHPRGKPSDSWPVGYPTRVYDGFKITGGGPEFFEAVVTNIKRMEKETPLLYRMAKKQIAIRGHINWNKGGSKAYCHSARITLGKRDWDYHKRRGAKDWFLIVMIHEFQHCNIPGDENEDGACWAGHFYGEKMNARRYFTNYQKKLGLSRGYNASKWQDNLRRTRNSLK